MIVIAVEFVVEADNADAFRDRVLAHARNSLEEPGCLRFDVSRDQADTNRFLLYELYADETAFEAHRQTTHLAAFFDLARPMFAAAPRIVRATSVHRSPG